MNQKALPCRLWLPLRSKACVHRGNAVPTVNQGRFDPLQGHEHIESLRSVSPLSLKTSHKLSLERDVLLGADHTDFAKHE